MNKFTVLLAMLGFGTAGFSHAEASLNQKEAQNIPLVAVIDPLTTGAGLDTTENRTNKVTPDTNQGYDVQIEEDPTEEDLPGENPLEEDTQTINDDSTQEDSGIS
ncbi:hypothetical protein [Ectobacillus panaciterrae]|uniref:hypothetical protein n=1 Tax=Ectobacillus panaciterrae TaxID=363872 RepID=UPI000413ABA7|nr:hypothetical protein [Ectobacillus panaciterrae]